MPKFFNELTIRQLLLLAKDFGLKIESPIEKDVLVQQLSSHHRAKTITKSKIANADLFEDNLNKKIKKKRRGADWQLALIAW